MVNEELIKWIKSEEVKGYTPQQLNEYLVKKGYNPSEVSEAIQSTLTISKKNKYIPFIKKALKPNIWKLIVPVLVLIFSFFFFQPMFGPISVDGVEVTKPTFIEKVLDQLLIVIESLIVALVAYLFESLIHFIVILFKNKK
tara:strand:- start:2281 stop:2703 length:423 start_codon:yes stop_codon:yes gene_type:complete